MRPFGEGYVEITRALSAYGEATFAELCDCPKWSKSGRLDPDTMEMVEASCPTCGAKKMWPVDVALKARIIERRREAHASAKALGESVAASLNEVLAECLKP